MRIRNVAKVWIAISELAVLAAACSTPYSTAPSDPDAGGPDSDVADAVDASDGTPSVDGATDVGADVPSVTNLGCSDGTREGFFVAPDIAACEGAWTVPGIVSDAGAPCARNAGNTGMNANGMGCGAQDLCAAGWHVCRDDTEVTQKTLGQTDTLCATTQPSGNTFFATAQPSTGLGRCETMGTNDVFGCGDFGQAPSGGCATLDVAIGTATLMPPGWSVGPSDTMERLNVVKSRGAGGVLCCRD